MPSDLECVQTYLRRQARRGRIAQALTAFTVYMPGADAPYAIPRHLRRTVRDADLDELHAIFRRQSARPRVEFLAELIPTCQSAWRRQAIRRHGDSPCCSRAHMTFNLRRQRTPK